MSFSKAVCVLCECPTADGAVLAVHVDKDKLQQWALNVCGHEIAHEIDDQDKICYFCLWQAEFLAEHEFMEESLVWWQGNLEFDDAAKLLRRKYFEGQVEQCWVQLEKIEMPSDETDGENPEGAGNIAIKQKCIYCGKNFGTAYLLRIHVTRRHKYAIRCQNHFCVTYFHTLEEREKHNEEVHQKQKIFKCQFCAKKINLFHHYGRHVRRMHKEFKIACSFRGCISYFRSEIEMQAHFGSTHKQGLVMKKFQCNDCWYASDGKIYMERHISRKHLQRTVKCEYCNKLFFNKTGMRRHVRDSHTFETCTICKQDVAVGCFREDLHTKMKTCLRCKGKFPCSGLYQKHVNACQETLFKCDKCPKTFNFRSLLEYHMKRKHGNNIRWLQYQSLGFKCDPCRRYYKSEKYLREHIRMQHNKANWKHCAHCSKSFPYFVGLKHHLSVKHNLIEGTFKCQKCDMKLTSVGLLRAHLQTHSDINARENCKFCGTSLSTRSMRGHLINIHGSLSNNSVSLV